jgi:hypothetical protein
MIRSIPSFRSSAHINDTWFLTTALQLIRGSELKCSEHLNGRLATFGFLIGVAIEVFIGHGILSFPPVRPEQFIAESSVLAQELTRALGLRSVFATAVGGAGSPALPQRGRGRVKTTQQWQ